MFYGDPGVRKTFVIVDLALAIAHGQPWLGRHGVVQRGVLYICPEGDPVTRVNAIIQDRGLPKVGRFYLCSNSMPLTTPEEFARLGQLIKSHGVGVVVIDPMSAAIRGLDENGQRDMTAFVGGLRDLCDELAVSFLIVHHAVKKESKSGKHERGSNVLRGTAEARIEVRPDGGELHLVSSKPPREGGAFKPVTVTFASFDLQHPEPTDPTALAYYNSWKADYGDPPVAAIPPVQTLVVRPAKCLVSKSKAQARQEIVLAALAGRGGRLRRKAWLDGSGVSESSFGRTVSDLVRSGRVIKERHEYVLAE